MPADPAVRAMLPGIVEPIGQSPVEAIDPLPLEYCDAAPAIERFNEVQQWVLARREVEPHRPARPLRARDRPMPST